MKKKNKKIKILCFLITLSFFGLNISSTPFFGGYFYTDNYFDKSMFNTSDIISFYFDNQFSDYVRFYTRVSTGLKYFANYPAYSDVSKKWVTPDNGELKNFTIIPSNIDLLYIELKSKRDEQSQFLLNQNQIGATNYDLFNFRVGRVHVDQGTGFFFNMNGDGFDLAFTLKNFRFRMFGITNSLDYMPIFDFMDGSSRPTFTNWDKKRYPLLSNGKIKGNENNFIGDIESSDYNFFFNSKLKDDYSDKEKERLNKLRYAAVLAGRVFSGFSFEFMQIYFQNFSVNFLANIDMIPEDFVVTFPSRVAEVFNTFGGRYTSFYLSFNANGKIVEGLYYNFESVYETGYNAKYNDMGEKITYENTLINSFAFNTGLMYYFNHVTKPTIKLNCMIANGDPDVIFLDGTIQNRENQDNNYRSPTTPSIGYVIMPNFSNLIVIEMSQTIKPFAALKNDVFSRFYIESGVLLMLRPVIDGSSFLSEKEYYQKNNDGYKSLTKAYLGAELDSSIIWQVFSDLSFQLKGGVLIPNYFIYSNNDVLWKVGLSMNISF